MIMFSKKKAETFAVIEIKKKMLLKVSCSMVFKLRLNKNLNGNMFLQILFMTKL